MNSSAIILCAGKGTRMNDDSKNKVCFDCAGVPVVKRIIENMRLGGVSRFVVVIGHQAYSVMDCLDGVEGVVYAYQKEQKGTGHAAMCGLKALAAVSYSGPVIISMGDKIIAPNVISDLLAHAKNSKAVWGVQPLSANKNGGRVVTENGKPYGIVEFADAALMTLADKQPEDYMPALLQTGLNPSKAEKVYKKALAKKPEGEKTLCGKAFKAEEIINSKYANAGLYCFDLESAISTIETIGANNAQGEIYITDALEKFASRDEAVIYEIKNPADMLTYSTKPELRVMSRHFMRKASEFVADIESGKLDATFNDLYREAAENQKTRYISLLNAFIAKYGDKKVVLTRSPGRINLMGRHIDHRGGGINVIATDKDTVFVSSPRDDDIINIANLNPQYPDRSFSISESLGCTKYNSWLDFLDDENYKEALKQSSGDWSNYVKSAVLRLQYDTELSLMGMDMLASGNIPVAAGLSSSSSIVVAVMEAAVSLNCLNITDKRFIDLCGEGEWYVGSRGGAGDHAAMKCGRRDTVVHLGFKPFEVGESAKFSDKYSVIVANSMIKAKKSEGSKDKFNSKVAAYEFAFMILKRNYPSLDLREFRDLAKIRPYSEIYKMLLTVPETMTRGGLKALLPEYKDQLERTFSTHADPGVYDLRGVALYGISECIRSEKCMDALRDGDYKLLGDMMKISHDGDRLKEYDVSDKALEKLASENFDISLCSGDYGCSVDKIDYLCDLLNATDGVLGSEIVGAGLGGCVIALTEKQKACAVINTLNEKYYDRFGFDRAANVYSAASGSSVIY